MTTRFLRRPAVWVALTGWILGLQCVALPDPLPPSDGDVCGGIAGIQCGAGDYCKFEEGVCGAGDQTGVCTPMPDVCIEIYAPVCGCDNQTYANECDAAAAGVSVAAQGECSP